MSNTFTEIPLFILEEYIDDIIISNAPPTNASVMRTFNHLFVGGEVGFGGYWVDFWVEKGTFDNPAVKQRINIENEIGSEPTYFKFNARPVTNPSYENENFDIVIQNNRESAYSTLNITTSASGYYSKVFNVRQFYEDEWEIQFEPGDPIYFRKDGSFIDWMNKKVAQIEKDLESLLAEEDSTLSDNERQDLISQLLYDQGIYKGLINTEIKFLKVGTIYNHFNNDRNLSDPSHAHISTMRIKDYAQHILPPHHTENNPKFKKFLNVTFDQVYTKEYNKLKRVQTLLDPQEVELDYLKYIARKYNTDVTQLIFSDKQTREFVRDIVGFLKRKGTYANLYLIKKLFSLSSRNKLNVYERWHDPDIPSAGSPRPYLEDHLYTNFYHYTDPYEGQRVDTSEPWTKEYAEFYPTKFGESVATGEEGIIISEHDSGKVTWKVRHNLVSNAITHHYFDMTNLNWDTVPNSIQNINPYETNIEWAIAPSAGYIIVSRGDSLTPEISGSKWVMNHNYGKYINIMFQDDQGLYHWPNSVELQENKTIVDWGDEIFNGSAVVISPIAPSGSWNVTEQHVETIYQELTEWEITHNLDYKFPFVTVYDEENKQFVPIQIELIDEDSIKIYLNKPTKGTAIITKPTAKIYSSVGKLLSTHYRVELDLTREPLKNNEIVDKSLLEGMRYLWEQNKPLSRVAEYNTLIAPETDSSGFTFQLYSSEYDAYYETKGLIGIPECVDTTDCIFYQSYPSRTWTINHNFNTMSIIPRVVEVKDGKKFYTEPKETWIIDNSTVQLSFERPIAGYCLLTKATQTIPLSASNISDLDIFYGNPDDDLRLDLLGLYSDSKTEIQENEYIQDTSGYDWTCQAVSGSIPLVDGVVGKAFNFNGQGIIKTEPQVEWTSEDCWDVEFYSLAWVKVDQSQPTGNWQYLLYWGNLPENVIDGQVIPYSEVGLSVEIEENNPYKIRVTWVYGGSVTNPCSTGNKTLESVVWDVDPAADLSDWFMIVFRVAGQNAGYATTIYDSTGTYYQGPGFTSGLRAILPPNNTPIYIGGSNKYPNKNATFMVDDIKLFHEPTNGLDLLDYYNRTPIYSSSNADYAHINIQNQYFIWDVYKTDSGLKKEVPQLIEATGDYSFNVDLIDDSPSAAGYYMHALNPTWVHTQSASSTDWIIQHDLYKNGLIVQAWDENNKTIYPKEVDAINLSVHKLKWDSPQTGTAALYDVGNITQQSEIIESLSYIILSQNGIENKNKAMPNLDEVYRINITDIRSKSMLNDDGSKQEYYIVEFIIPSNISGIWWNEVALMTEADQIAFYSNHTTIEKPDDIAQKYLYRIRKQINIKSVDIQNFEG